LFVAGQLKNFNHMNLRSYFSNIVDEFIQTPALVKVAYILLIGATGLAFWFLCFGGFLFGEFLKPDPDKARDIQPFIGGLVLPLLTLGSTLLVIANLRSNNAQNFNSNFFKLIDQHHRLVDNIESFVDGAETASKGSEFFDDLASRIAIDFETLSATQSGSTLNSAESISETHPESLASQEVIKYEMDSRLTTGAQGKTGKELLIVIYDHFFHLHQSDLGHCIRNLYYVVRFVENSSISRLSKFEAIKILRSQLSNYELLLIAYNGLHEYGKEFYPLIEKYELLKSLNHERRVSDSYEKRIIDTKVLTEAYPQLEKYWNQKTSS
jgi:hypothetical protein